MLGVDGAPTAVEQARRNAVDHGVDARFEVADAPNLGESPGYDTVIDVADRLFDAIENSDIAVVERLFSPEVAVWKSGDVRDNDHARSVRIIA